MFKLPIVIADVLIAPFGNGFFQKHQLSATLSLSFLIHFAQNTAAHTHTHAWKVTKVELEGIVYNAYVFMYQFIFVIVNLYPRLHRDFGYGFFCLLRLQLISASLLFILLHCCIFFCLSAIL